jgi:hypothetical protein
VGSVEGLRGSFTWHRDYRPEWDAEPERYADEGWVPWGKSRRLGLLTLGNVKAYLGVQHVDPDRPGWRIVDEPTARYFVSLFVNGRVVTLRTFGTVVDALEWLQGEVAKVGQRDG